MPTRPALAHVERANERVRRNDFGLASTNKVLAEVNKRAPTVSDISLSQV